MARKLAYMMLTVIGALVAGPSQSAELVIPASAEATARSEREQKINRFLFHFELPEGLANARIDRALLRLDVDRSNLVIDAIQLRLLPVRDDWTVQGGATLSQLPTANDSAGISWIIQKADSGFAMIDIESIVDDWVRGRYPNRGVLVMPFENPEENMTLKEYTGKTSIVRAELHISYRPNRSADIRQR
jgi:hypothetical protein